MEQTTGYDCDVCGDFELEQRARVIHLEPNEQITNLQRAALSHHLRKAASDDTRPKITNDWLNIFLKDCRLPSAAIQATNFIRCIGDQVSTTGVPFLPDVDTPAKVGSFSNKTFSQLLNQLRDKKLIFKFGTGQLKLPDGTEERHDTYDLTLDGWELYDAEFRGEFSGKYGFIAMKFNDPILDAFVEDTVKPAVKSGTGYDLVDMRDVSQPGIIDNIMRTQIREAAFVIVDLTHDNSGAYWEAGFAEGLGKPVIYICEQKKFNKKKTHFDTNHCTTVPWSKDKPDEFGKQLVATLRGSTILFSDTS